MQTRSLDHCGPVLTTGYKFDAKKGATWHCIVGRNFGSFVTHGEFRFGDGRPVYLGADCIRDRNQALHILLPWPRRHPPLQNAMIRSGLGRELSRYEPGRYFIRVVGTQDRAHYVSPFAYNEPN